MTLFIRTLVVLLVASVVSAQPPDQPRFQPGDLTYLGTFRVPDSDGTGTSEDNQFVYSAIGVAGVAGPGQLFYACHAQRSARLGIVAVPALDGVAKVVEPCRQMPNLDAMGTDQSPRFTGGAMVYNGRTLVDAYIYYDGSGTQANTHWYGTSTAAMSGPVNVQANNVLLTNSSGVTYRPKAGMMAGWMGLVPQEWRATMGGPAFTGQGAIAITSRSSFGPALSVFNPDDLGKGSPVAATMLMGYPDEYKYLGEWGSGAWGTSPISQYYSGADTVGAVFWPVGTRSVVSIGRHGTGLPEMKGMNCYGPGTKDATLIGTSDGQGNRYCYDPSNGNKGPHSYPYKGQAMAFDVLDFIAVKAGTKQPWDMRPYAVWNFGTGTPLDQPGMTVVGAAYDPSAGRLYVSTGSTTVYVFKTGAGVSPPSLPTSVNDTYSTAWATTLTVAAPGVLSNDSTNGGGAMTAGIVTPPTLGTVTLATSGGFTFTPVTAGVATFTYRAQNTSGVGNTATVSITVGAQPPPPSTGTLLVGGATLTCTLANGVLTCK